MNTDTGKDALNTIYMHVTIKEQRMKGSPSELIYRERITSYENTHVLESDTGPA